MVAKCFALLATPRSARIELDRSGALTAMVRDGPSGLLTMRLRSANGLILSLSKYEQGRKPVSKPHP
jgi:hypothetical protein